MLMFALMVIALDPAAAEWERMHIDWLAEAGVVRNLEQVLPRREAQLLRLLDDDRYIVRTLAQDEIARMGDQAHEMLTWGCRVDKPSVSELCKLLRARLFWCHNCYGRGKCPACVFDDRGYREYCGDGCDYCNRCIECDGAGDLRFRRTGIWDEDGEEYVERDLFGLGGKP